MQHLVLKYLGVKIDKNLNWHHHINGVAHAFLFKIRNYVNQRVLRSIYFEIFDSHLIYENLTWAQNSNAIQRIIILQKKHRNNIISATKLSFKSFFSGT